MTMWSATTTTTRTTSGRTDGTLEGTPLARTWEPERRASLIALLVVILGAAGLAAVARPDPPADDSTDVCVVRDMIIHHDQAVLMSDIINERSTDQLLDVITADISNTQTTQVGIMFGWLEL